MSLLHDPESLFSFDDNLIILPLSVIEELDLIKKRVDEIKIVGRLREN